MFKLRSLMAVFVPAIGLIPTGNLLQLLFTTYTGSPQVQPILGTLYMLLLSLAAGSSAVLSGKILHEERATWTAQLRMSLLFILFCYAVASLIRPLDWKARFLPGFANLWPTFYLGAQWFYSLYIQGILKDRDLYLVEIEGKSGQELQITIREQGPFVEEALAGLRRVRGIAGTLALLPIPFLILAHLTDVPIPLFTAIAIGIGFILLPAVRGVTAHYESEQFMEGAGLPMGSRLRKRRLGTIILGSVTLGITGFLLVGKESIFSLAKLLAFLDSLLAKLFKGSGEPFWPDSGPQSTEFPLEEMLSLAEKDKALGWDLRWLIEFIHKAAPYAAVLLLVLFLVSPLFSKNFRIALKQRSIRVYLREKWKDLWGFIRRKKPRDEGKVSVEALETAQLRKRLERLIEASGSKRDRRELGRIVRAFMALIRWGQARGLPYTAATAPGDYTQTVAAQFPLSAKDILFVGEIFERAMYSHLPLSPESLGEYEKRVRTLIKSPPAEEKTHPAP